MKSNHKKIVDININPSRFNNQTKNKEILVTNYQDSETI